MTAEPGVARISPGAKAALRALVCGVVLTPDDPGYRDAAALHNAAVERSPAAVVQVGGVDDVVVAVRFARQRGLSLSVRGGGHGVAGHAMGGDIVIDLSALRDVMVDPQARTAVVRGGATWADVDAATQAHGLAVPAEPADFGYPVAAVRCSIARITVTMSVSPSPSDWVSLKRA